MASTLMHDEGERLRTFTGWRVPFITSQSLVEDGFYYTGSADIVRCAYCDVEIGYWEKHDVPKEEHRKSSPTCPCVASNSNLLLQQILDDLKPEPLAYSRLEDRLSSFENWPKEKPQRPRELALSGFYYLGEGDKTVCFSCGIGLNEWQDEDDAFEEHSIWSPKCAHLLECIDQYISVYSY